MIVVFLGPDGCGKSSVIERLERELSAHFSEVRVYHLRPRWRSGGPRQGAPVLHPHAAPPRSAFSSLAKLVYLTLDYATIHFWRLSASAARRSTLTMFDRYYHDLLVDPRRHRYGAPMWLARCFAYLMPSPDLWILLDAPAEVIHRRKQEVPLHETARQCQAFRELIAGLPNAHMIDATGPLDQVARSAQQLIFNQVTAMNSVTAKIG